MLALGFLWHLWVVLEEMNLQLPSIHSCLKLGLGSHVIDTGSCWKCRPNRNSLAQWLVKSVVHHLVIPVLRSGAHVLTKNGVKKGLKCRVFLCILVMQSTTRQILDSSESVAYWVVSSRLLFCLLRSLPFDSRSICPRRNISVFHSFLPCPHLVCLASRYIQRSVSVSAYSAWHVVSSLRLNSLFRRARGTTPHTPVVSAS